MTALAGQWLSSRIVTQLHWQHLSGSSLLLACLQSCWNLKSRSDTLNLVCPDGTLGCGLLGAGVMQKLQLSQESRSWKLLTETCMRNEQLGRQWRTKRLTYECL
eukprot:3421181-Amphidinium_carterae.2